MSTKEEALGAREGGMGTQGHFEQCGSVRWSGGLQKPTSQHGTHLVVSGAQAGKQGKASREAELCEARRDDSRGGVMALKKVTCCSMGSHKVTVTPQYRRQRRKAAWRCVAEAASAGSTYRSCTGKRSSP